MAETRFPFGIDATGRTAEVRNDERARLRQLIELVLLTRTGERINRPDFGTNLGQLVFAPISSDIAAATAALAHSSLQRWLAREIEVIEVSAVAEESTLHLTVRYRSLSSGSEYNETITS